MPGPGNLDDVPFAIESDDSSNLYVTGYSFNGLKSSDYSTIKYNSAGVQQWVARYTGPGNSYDFPNSMALDASGNVYVTGSSNGIGTSVDYATIKYNSAGAVKWVERFNGPANSYDFAYSIALDNSGNVIVTGMSYNGKTGEDYVTIKYSQTTGINQSSSELPEHFRLSQNFPNPFNPVTNIEFQISKWGFVTLKIYDLPEDRAGYF